MTIAKPVVEFSVTIQLNETELRALDALFSYNPEDFLNGCYQKLGRAYIAPFADGIRSLHRTVRSFATPAIREINSVRHAIKKLP